MQARNIVLVSRAARGAGSVLGLLAAWGWCAAPAFADLYTWENGDPFEAEALQLIEPDRVRLRLDDASVKTVALAELSAESAYRVRVHFLAPSDASGHVKLGEYMQSRQCYRVAMVEFRIARDLDASLSAAIEEKLQACAQASAKDMLESALALNDAARRDHAKTMLDQLVDEHPETEAANAARDLLKTWAQPAPPVPPARDEAAPETLQQPAPAPELATVADAPAAAPDTGHTPPPVADAPAMPAPQVKLPTPDAAVAPSPASPPGAQDQGEESARVLKLLDQAVAAHEAAHEQYRIALRFDAEYNEGKARKGYENAAARLEFALQALDSVRRNAQRAETRVTAIERHARSRELLVRVYLSVAHLHAGATRISEAYRFCTLALSLDDGNEWALKLRQKITEHRLETRIVRKVPPVNPADE